MRCNRCHLCGRSDPPLYLEGPPAVLRCPRCGLAFLETFPEPDERIALYQDQYYDEASGGRFFALFEKVIEAFRRARRRDILRHLPAAQEATPPAILDVGCGRGLLLDTFRREGWRVTGTQVSETARRACERERGIDVRRGELPDLGLEAGSFRAITFYHVLEHLDRPLEYLEEARRLLRPDGLVVLEVPDASGPGFRALGVRNLCLDHPHHLFFFSPRSLRWAAEKAGLEVAGVSRFSLEYSPFTCLQNLLNWLPGPPNRLYDALKTNDLGRRLRRSPVTWLHAALAGVLALPAFAVSLAGLALPTGNTLRMYCRRRNAPPGPRAVVEAARAASP